MSEPKKWPISRLAILLIVILILGIVASTIILIFAFLPSENAPWLEGRLADQDHYLIGVGRADCTGPVAEVPFIGYGTMDQNGAGIITRQYCRTFIVAEPQNRTKRVVYVTAEIGMISQRLRLEVMKQLKQKYGEMYRQDNVILSATHTHSGPGGYFQNTIFMIASKGFIKPSLNAIVNGVIKSIDVAHQNMREGHIFINKGVLLNSQINRSPFSYLQNSKSERERYSSDTDQEMVILKMTDVEGQDIGLFSWFAIHPVSMNSSNRFTSSDNVGYAAYLFEQEKNKGYLTGEGPYVAAFGSSNLGDVSSNTKGPHCTNTGESCENLNNYCPIGGAKMCIASGPGKDMFESTKIIGRNLYLKAKELSMAASEEIYGPLNSAHEWLNMANRTVQLNATHSGKTCKPALGYSFAAGTMDGPGMFNFTQGAIHGDPFWDAVRNGLLAEPSNESVECQKPKPILIPTGEMSKPYPWHPDIIDVQMVTIGPVVIVALPGEFTTMAGRRTREAVKSEFEAHGKPGMHVILAGLCNVYTHYITTFEEYQIQRYEGASTIFGPHTLSAYIQSFRELVQAIVKDTVRDLPSYPEPSILNISVNFLLPVIDAKPLGRKYGDVLQDVEPMYRVGEVASAQFVGANPRNSAENMSTLSFLTVEKYDNTSASWKIRYNDASWDTRFIWQKGDWGRSTAIVQWHIPNNTEPGTYRLQYFGHHKELLSSIHAFRGTSSEFEVLNLEFVKL
ncbi:neutral ceramidase [Eublepharis macularius]|uniref:Neutral ceramidase n=1 Tax=Eublepharis macularius TaxID=481883 RepID=A0AA97JH54_EUBMA|nr:neutral ceramidase [Eublepharis macularius]XP_054838663.1 neutral ceramidase [Eublepharis macularius]XP_054838665.1 neutral ceramidase [Eublepharis macularius]XP_054838666.1 neutral ceramidase [Eublepharis macularius]XP_054838667.1 neutral ceramidase [Eublepharis macularius]